MPDDYTVRLTARQEGVEYRAGGETYRFDVMLHDGEWTIYLPCTRGESYTPHDLTDSEAAAILPRVVRLLEVDRLFGIPIRRYPVRVSRRP